ncbi:MAG: YHS domain-containing (seleno)protein [Opitutales bacterium]
MNTFKNIILVAVATIVTSVNALAAKAGDYDLPAAGGYDLVSYHQDSGPVRGSGFHVSEYKGVNYIFANEENKATFDANPEAYLPAYNGYCAFGVALGKKFHTDPLVYEIVDGVLYLNLDKDIQGKWSEDIRGHITKANQNWAKIQ